MEFLSARESPSAHNPSSHQFRAKDSYKILDDVLKDVTKRSKLSKIIKSTNNDVSHKNGDLHHGSISFRQFQSLLDEVQAHYHDSLLI